MSGLSGGDFFDAFFGVRIVDEAMDEDAGGVDFVGVEVAGLDDDLGFGDGDLAAGGGEGVEVARGTAVDEVAEGVGLPGFDEGDVDVDAALEDVGVAVEVFVLLAFGDESADAGAGVEAGDAGTTGSHAFGEGALRGEFDFELSGEILPFELGVFTDITGDHFFDLMGFEEEANSPLPFSPDIGAGVVAGDGEVAYTGVAEGEDEGFGDAAETEAADGKEHTVAHDAAKSCVCVGP